MEVFLIRALQLILCFSILVLLHEWGHFFFAKLFHIRVEKFCVFFDPWFTVFKFKPKHSDTTYALGWLPLGGYTKIAGMIDESMDTEQMKKPPQPWEFRSKPAWQRLLVMIGGVLVNFLLALFIYAMVLFVWGDTYVPLRAMTYGMKFNTEAQALGFRDGDLIVGTDKERFTRFDTSESIADVYRGLSTASEAHVLRNGHQVTIPLSGHLNMLDMMKHQPPFVAPLSPSVIDSVSPGSPAAKVGMRKGDRLLAYGDRKLSTWNEYYECRMVLDAQLARASARDSQLLRRVTVVFCHAGATQPDTAHMLLTPDYLMGVTHNNPLMLYKTEHRSYGFFESFPAGISHGWNVLTGYVDDLKYLFTADGAKSVGSFGTIGALFPAKWNWQRFWELTAFISLILAFMNILPIPALDGGHVFFLLYEVVTRRKPSEKVLVRAQVVGMSLLLLLMVWAIFNDITRFLF